MKLRKAVAILILAVAAGALWGGMPAWSANAQTVRTDEIPPSPVPLATEARDSAYFEGMAPDLATIIRRGKLLCALPADDTPLFHESDGAGGVMGIDVDLARGIADSLGVEAVFDRSSQTFSDMTDKLKRGEVDLIVSTYSITTERNMYVNLSAPYLETYLSVLVGKQELVRNKIEHSPLEYMKTNPVKIGAVSSTAHFGTAQALFPNAEIVPLQSYEEGYDKVVSGELFAFLSGELEFLSGFERDPTLSIYAAAFSFTDLRDQFCVGVSRETPQLLNYVNTYLRTNRMITYDEVAQAYAERFGEGDAHGEIS